MTNLFFSTNAAFMLNPQPDLSGNPFLLGLQVLFKLNIFCKKDWEPFDFAQDKLHAEKLPKPNKVVRRSQINLINPKNRIKPMRFLVVVGMFVNPIQLRLAVVCKFWIDSFFHFERGF